MSIKLQIISSSLTNALPLISSCLCRHLSTCDDNMTFITTLTLYEYFDHCCLGKMMLMLCLAHSRNSSIYKTFKHINIVFYNIASSCNLERNEGNKQKSICCPQKCQSTQSVHIRISKPHHIFRDSASSSQVTDSDVINLI